MSRPPPPQLCPVASEAGYAVPAAELLQALPNLADASKDRTVQVGQRVSAWFYGEWHPAVVRRCEERAIEVRWESEASVSVLPRHHVQPLAFASPPDSATAETREASGSISSLDFMSSAASTSPGVSLARDEIGELEVGDEVSASFYGEWYPAVVRKLEGDIVEVLWKSELTVSRLPLSEVRPVARSAPAICNTTCQASDDSGETRRCAKMGSGQDLGNNGGETASAVAETYVPEPALASLPHSKVRSWAGVASHGRSIGEPSPAKLEKKAAVMQVPHGSVQEEGLNRCAQERRPSERKHPAGAAIGDFKQTGKPRAQEETLVVTAPATPSKSRQCKAEHLAEHQAEQGQADRQKKPQADCRKKPPKVARSPTSPISSNSWADVFEVSEEEEEEEEVHDDQDGHVELDIGKEVTVEMEGEEKDNEQMATSKDKRKARQLKKKKAKALKDEEFDKCLEEFAVA